MNSYPDRLCFNSRPHEPHDWSGADPRGKRPEDPVEIETWHCSGIPFDIRAVRFPS